MLASPVGPVDHSPQAAHRGYLLVAVVVAADDLDLSRKIMRGMPMPGQARWHTKDESDPRRRSMVSTIVDMDVQVTVYDTARRYRNERERRANCLRALVDDAALRADTMLVLEQDDSMLSWDNQHLIEFTRAAGCRDRLRYEHRKAREEPLLAIPDTIAWCWARGGAWRRRIQPVVFKVHEI